MASSPSVESKNDSRNGKSACARCGELTWPIPYLNGLCDNCHAKDNPPVECACGIVVHWFQAYGKQCVDCYVRTTRENNPGMCTRCYIRPPVPGIQHCKFCRFSRLGYDIQWHDERGELCCSCNTKTITTECVYLCNDCWVIKFCDGCGASKGSRDCICLPDNEDANTAYISLYYSLYDPEAIKNRRRGKAIPPEKMLIGNANQWNKADVRLLLATAGLTSLTLEQKKNIADIFELDPPDPTDPKREKSSTTDEAYDKWSITQIKQDVAEIDAIDQVDGKVHALALSEEEAKKASTREGRIKACLALLIKEKGLTDAFAVAVNDSDWFDVLDEVKLRYKKLNPSFNETPASPGSRNSSRNSGSSGTKARLGKSCGCPTNRCAQIQHCVCLKAGRRCWEECGCRNYENYEPAGN